MKGEVLRAEADKLEQDEPYAVNAITALRGAADYLDCSTAEDEQ